MPTSPARGLLVANYAAMIADELILSSSVPFDAVMQHYEFLAGSGE